MQSNDMSNSGSGGRYFWCLRHHRVETEADKCVAVDRLGPFGSAEEARNALDKVAERNAAWEAEDTRWSGEDT